MPQGVNNTAINPIAFVGNYLPRQCGIATFITDLYEALAAEYCEITCSAKGTVFELQADRGYAVNVPDIGGAPVLDVFLDRIGTHGRRIGGGSGVDVVDGHGRRTRSLSSGTRFPICRLLIRVSIKKTFSVSKARSSPSPWPPAVSARFSSGSNTMGTNQRQH